MAEICITVAGKVAELLVVPIGKHICYPFKCQSNIDCLKKQVEKLEDLRNRVQHDVDEANRQVDWIEDDVSKWLNSVDEFIQGVKKTIIEDEENAKKRCFIGLCPNLMMRYSLSKKAANKTKDGVVLFGEGKFKKVAYRQPLQKIPSSYSRGYDDFDSRKENFNDLMEALRKADVNLIGVYGMGGVGKTTLVKKVAAQALEEQLFDVVVMVEVTETTPDIKNIQGQIADKLGLKFQEETLQGRAGRLCERLKKEKKVLIVLDNIWEKLYLDAVGIPSREEEDKRSSLQVDRKGRNDEQRQSLQADPKGKNDELWQCKVLLTSRKLHVLRDMNIRKNVPVQILSPEESKVLFWNIVVDSKKKIDFDDFAVEIVKYCAGLPVAIATIANALKNRSSYDDWKRALDQLSQYCGRHIIGMDANVYSPIKMSYDFLEIAEAKSLFLLCSLFNASCSISIVDLLKYGTGLRLFQDVSTLEQRRNKLHTLINILKDSCLLLEGDTNDDVKMHDIIHDVAVSIASTYELMFNVQDVTDLEETLEEKLHKDSTAISLPYKDVSVLPRRLEYSKLRLLFLFMDEFSLQIPNSFFEGIKKLEVLNLTKIHMLSLPLSLGWLTNLQTLCLDQCQLRNIAIIGELKRLEILCFRGSDIKHLPKQIGQLTRLRLLELSNCSTLEVISPNVISSLTRLEELYMGNSFTQWDVEGQSNASLSELKELCRLTTLEIHVLDAQVMPEDLLIFEKLERFRIIIGDAWEWSDDFESSRRLKLIDSIVLGKGVKMLLNRTEDLYLDELKGVKNVLYELNVEEFPQLKHLQVQNGHEIQCIVHSIQRGLCNVFPKLESLFLHNLINLEKLFHGQLTTKSLAKLRILKIGKCDRLEHLFSFSMAKNLLQLEEIEVTECEKLKEIVFNKKDEQIHQSGRVNGTEFTRLRTLRLQRLPQLTSFGFNKFTPNTGHQEIHVEDELGSCLSSFGQNVLLPSLENLKLSSIKIECLWLDQLPAMSSCCQTLTSLTLEGCSGNLKFLFSYSMVKSLVLLEKLEIQNCVSIEGVVNSEELSGEGNIVEFPKLIKLQLKGLPNLTQFASGNTIKFPSLTQLSIKDCQKMKTFSPALVYPDIKQSKDVKEMNCQDDIHPFFDEKVMLPTLASINLSSIPIRTIWHNQLRPMSSWFQNLKEIIMDGCDTVKYGLPSSMVESLVQLEVLKISNCKLMEVVTIAEGERISNTLFTKLHRLHLKHLPELTTFCNFAGKLIELTSLAELWLENCPKMHAFVSNSPRADMPAAKEEQMNSEKNLQYSHIQPFFDEKVRIIDLKSLHIEKMDNMRKIWCRQLMMGSFSKIDSFEVYDCHNLLNIFPSNMLGRLQKLAVLEVSDCKSVEVIFEGLNTTEEDVVIVPRFVFPQLTCLCIQDLPSLRSFYPGLYISEWPKLNKLRMWRCNKVKILTLEFSSFEKSHGGSQPENSIQEQLFIVDKVAFSKIEHLALEWNWIVKEILHRNFSKYSCNLKVVELISASKQSGICPCCFLCTLTNLERLDVYHGFFEEIFACEELDCKKKHVETPSKLSQLKLFDLAGSLHQWEEDSLLCKVFRNLTSLEVLKCHDLKNLAPSFVSFQNLKKLEVSHCDGLVNLIEVSVAKSLVNLTRLKISECKMIEEIIMHGVDEVENQMIFNQLEYLELHSLPKLTSFCSWNCNIEFPSLQQIVVRQCPTMEIFSQGVIRTPKLQRIQTAEVDDEGSWEGSLNTTIQKLFKDMIGFRDFEHLTTSEFPHLKEVWHGQFPVQVFCNLKSLVMDDCANISSAISGNLLQHLNSLEKLHVRNGDSLEEVFDLEELNADGDLKVLSQLSEFFLVDLPRLEHIWKKNHSEVLGFRNLKLMKVYNCSSLRYIFTPSVVLGLMQLQILEIKNCAIMQEIITMEGENDAAAFEKITFLQLNCLVVESLPNFTSFYSGSSTLECPSLTTINISDCPKMETFVFTHLKDICTVIVPLFSEKVELPTLASLNLSSIASQTIWHNQLQAHSTCFHSLTKLNVYGCHNLKYLFPFSVAESLNNLEVLHIWNCKLMEGVITTQGERKSSTLFPKLKELTLKDLPELTRFRNFNGNSIELPSLSELTIRDCPKMQTFASNSLPGIEEPEEVNTDTEENLPSFFDEKISFSCLKILLLSDLPELLHLWKENSQPRKVFENLAYLEVSGCSNLKTLVPSSVSLQNLETLEVRNCDGLISLVTFSTAKSLKQMKRMEIIDCKLIEEIIIDTGDGIKDVIVFNQMEYLKLRDLPSLTSFCKGSFTIKFPYLQQVLMIKCLKMMNFSQGDLSTPKLQSLRLTESIDEWKWKFKGPVEDKEDEGCWEGDLNTTIQKLFRDMVKFRDIENFTVSEFPHLKELWHKKLLASYFSNLKSLVVDDKYCSLRYIFTPSVALGLAQLQDLEIKNCVVLEVITVIGEETISNTMFPNLNSLMLMDLPNLTCFSNFAGNSIELPSLTRLSIENCPNMETFISNFLGVDMSTSKDNCHTNMQPLFDEKVGFPSLEKMVISGMDNLESIWHNQFLGDSFYKLKSVEVNDCQELKTIFSSCICERLLWLESLTVKSCGSAIEIFDLRGINLKENLSIQTTPQLRELYVDHMSNLKHIWNEDPKGMLSFEKLEKVTVFLCPNLENLFPASVAKSLLNLDSLEVSDCGVEEIIAKEGVKEAAADRFLFPQLSSLQLHNLPRLRTFYLRHTVEGPCLKRLGLHHCDKVTLFVSESLGFYEKIEEGQLDISIHEQLPFFLVQEIEGTNQRFPNLEELQLSGKTMAMRWPSQVPGHVFRSLKSLELNDHESTVVPLNFIQRFGNLEKLSLNSSSYNKEIFSYGKDKEHPEIKHLVLSGLFDLKQIWKQGSKIDPNFQNLQILEVRSCFNLINLMPSSASFQNLMILEVWGCDSLKNLLTSSTAKSLVLLEKLEVFDCKMLTEVVANDGAVREEIVFGKLKSLSLVYLQSLASFCSAKHTLNFPILESLVVNECPKMKIFSKGVTSTSTPKLHELELNWKAIEHSWEVGVNTTIQQNMERGLLGR